MGAAGPFSCLLTGWDQLFRFFSWCFSDSAILESNPLSKDIPVLWSERWLQHKWTKDELEPVWFA